MLSLTLPPVPEPVSEYLPPQPRPTGPFLGQKGKDTVIEALEEMGLEDWEQSRRMGGIGNGSGNGYGYGYVNQSKGGRG